MSACPRSPNGQHVFGVCRWCGDSADTLTRSDLEAVAREAIDEYAESILTKPQLESAAAEVVTRYLEREK